MSNTYLGVISILFAAISVVDGNKCVLPGKVFTWAKCPGFKGGPIETTSIDAIQDGKTVEQNGGLDLHKPLTLTFGLKNNYQNEIPDHEFDFKPYQYADDDGPCQWYELEVGGATDGIDACNIIKDNCKYKGRPTKVVVTYDFPKMLAEYGASVDDFMSSGGYYAFEVTERDGTTKLNCIRMQAKIK